MSERIRASAIMQQLDVGMLSVEIFFQMSSCVNSRHVW